MEQTSLTKRDNGEILRNEVRKFREGLDIDINSPVAKTLYFIEESLGKVITLFGNYDGISGRVTELEHEGISAIQQGELEKERRKRVTHLFIDGKKGIEYKVYGGAYFKACGEDLKHKFSTEENPVEYFSCIPKTRFKEALEYVRNWKPINDKKIKYKVQIDMLNLEDEIYEMQQKINRGLFETKDKELEAAVKIEKNRKKLELWHTYKNREI